MSQDLDALFTNLYNELQAASDLECQEVFAAQVKRNMSNKASADKLISAVSAKVLALETELAALKKVKPTVPQGMKEIFLDHFDDSAINSTTWAIYGATGVGLSTYGQPVRSGVNSPLAITTKDSKAVFTTTRLAGQTMTDGRQKYQVGFIGTRDARPSMGRQYYPKWGKYEVRARFDPAYGIWPCPLWLRSTAGSATAEVDVMEHFFNIAPSSARQAVHLMNDLTGATTHNVRSTLLGLTQDFPIADVSGWHTYAVTILPDGASDARFIYEIDGVQTYSMSTKDFPATKPHRGWINKISGFDLAVCVQTGGPAGEPSSTAADGWKMEIDYIQVCEYPV